jgi:hypothetical protein
MISDAARESFEHLKGSDLVELTTDLEEVDGLATFGCALPSPQPNAEHLPERVVFDVRLPAAFPFGKVAFVPKDSCLDGFPHQASRGLGGALCLLLSESEYPWEPKARLLAHVRSAVEWLADAANSQLLKDGEPWELPDFRIAPSVPAPRPIFFAETAASLAVWGDRVGKSGTADIGYHSRTRALVPLSFSADGVRIHMPTVSPTFCDPARAFPCDWLLLPSFIYTRHRPPRTFGELAEFASRAGLDVWPVIRKELKKRSAVDGHHYLLVGAPIPSVVGGPSTEIHWQAIAIPAKTAASSLQPPKGFRPKAANGEGRDQVVSMLKDAAIPWSQSTNVGGERLQVRGLLEPDARAKRVCLVGCGAIGSVLAEHLARGGAHDLTLFDNDTAELQNLTRHTLAAAEVGQNKARAVAARLSGIHPGSTIVGFAADVPLGLREKSSEEQHASFDAADVLIDCSTNESAFRSMSVFGRAHGKRVIHIYANARARMLTVCCSGRHASCSEVARRLYAEIQVGDAPFSWDEYDPIVPEIESGAGCWHPTFPAKGHDLAALVGAATPLIERLMARPFSSRGTAIVLRRNEIADAFVVGPLVETAFVRDYR